MNENYPGCSPYDEVAPVSDTKLETLTPEESTFWSSSLRPRSDTSLKSLLGDYESCFYVDQKSEYIKLIDSFRILDDFFVKIKLRMPEDSFVVRIFSKVLVRLSKHFKSAVSLQGLFEKIKGISSQKSSLYMTTLVLLATVQRLYLSENIKIIDSSSVGLYTKNKSKVTFEDSVDFLFSLIKIARVILEDEMSIQAKSKVVIPESLILQDIFKFAFVLRKSDFVRIGTELKLLSSIKTGSWLRISTEVALGIGYGSIGYGEGGYGL